MSRANRKKTSKKPARPKKTKEQKVMQAKEKAIYERNRIALAYMELAKDKTFQKLEEDYKLDLVKEVLAIGDEVASWVVAEYGTNDPRKIAAQLGVKVFGEDSTDKKKKTPSEYRKEKKEIVVYRDFHEKLLREVRSTELSENLLKFVVAHELFHHLEINRIGEVYKRYKFLAWRLGPYAKEKNIRGLSDVAAQAFTLSLLELDISPQVFDYLTYILYTNP
ncbi:MAG: hypothetical protein HQ596_06155 [Candidatus Saganbacteria bacterium]|nr:hypothetical protein [Candidatus Saganbacteria bacterium]